MPFSKTVNDVLARVARETGVSLKLLRAFCWIESRGKPHLMSPSGYKGLFQLSEYKFKKYGGKGSIFDPYANALAAAWMIKDETEIIAKKDGKPPTGARIYMAHQQGMSGSAQHYAHPERAAWASMHATTEGKKRGAQWSKKAIWGNLTPDAKKKFGTVENVSSGDFIQFWTERFAKALDATKTV